MWEQATTMVQKHIVPMIAILILCILLLLIFCIILLCKIQREKKRYDFFMGINRRPDYNLETKMSMYFEQVKAIDEKYTKLLDMVTDLDQSAKQNICKVGLVRYNPFQEMGGKLCFAVALLDHEDNGVVLNGIHSRTGSFTYAKPIEMGVSTYILSEEEQQAIAQARNVAYKNKHEKVKKLKIKKLFKRRYVPDVLPHNVQKLSELYSDATQQEQQQIEKSTKQADAVAEGQNHVKRFEKEQPEHTTYPQNQVNVMTEQEIENEKQKETTGGTKS